MISATAGGRSQPDDREIALKPAWLDESFHEHDETGFYIVAAAVVEMEGAEAVRAGLRRLRGRRDTAKAHWREMDDRDRHTAARLVAAQPGLHVVVIGAPVPRRKQERARSKCLTALIPELHGFGVNHLYIESRDETLNARDIRTIVEARRGLPKGTVCRAEHVSGATEPLLWMADIVAGAVRTQRQGDTRFIDILRPVVMDFEIPTGC